MYERLSTVEFPEPRDLKVNMMPILLGDVGSIPEELRGYAPLIDTCIAPWRKERDERELLYLSVHESPVEEGTTQRRPGIHTEATIEFGWGNNPWGGDLRHEGIYMASSDGHCRIWDTEVTDVDHHGSVLGTPTGSSEVMIPNVLYWLTDKTPHEAMPTTDTHYRQWFRLVVGEVGVWWAKHNTPNPLGVLPDAPVRHDDKFART